MSIIENATPAEVQAFHQDSQRAEQTLRLRGQIKQPASAPNYDDTEIDLAVQDFVDTAVAIGYAGAAPLPDTSAVVTDGQSIVLGAETFTFTVAGGVVTAIVVS